MEQPGRFSLRSSEVQDQAVCFVFDLIKLWTKFIFASILTSCRLILFVSLQYLTFSRTKLRFCFNLDKLKANIFHFASLSEAVRVIPEALRKSIEAARLFVEAVRVLEEAVRVLEEAVRVIVETREGLQRPSECLYRPRDC